MTKRDQTIVLSAAAAAAGVALSLLARRRPRPRDVTAYRARTARTVTVRRTTPDCYQLWRERFPEFFRGVNAVEAGEAGSERWNVQAGKRTRTLDVRVIHDRPGERIEWHAERLGRYAAHALVTFNDVGARGSEVRLSLALDGPLARTNAAFARLFGSAPSQIAADSLRNFKALAEAGELPKAMHN